MGGGRDGQVTVGGLENDSAFCFMNSVLQSMASLDRLDEFLGGTQYEGVELETTTRKRYEESSEEEDDSDEGVENGPEEGPVSEAETEIEQVPEGAQQDTSTTVPEAEDDLEEVNAEAEAKAEEEPKQPTALELSSLIPGFPAQPEKADPEEVTEVSETSTTVQNPICPSSLESFHSSTGLGAFSYELKRMFAQLNTLSTRSHTYSGLPITRAMGKSGQRWDGYEQEDAGEFFQQLIDKLENEVKAKAGGEEEKKPTVSDNESALDKWKNKMLIPFDGVQATTIKCLSCGDLGDGIRYNIMGALGLSLPNQTSRYSRSTHTLKECIDMFAEREIIDGVSCERCSLREYKRQVEDQISKVADQTSPLVQLFQARLDKVDTALSRDTINEEEYNDIFKKNTGGFAKVFVQKSKQTLIGVAPQILCVTINRSQFDMNTGMSFKNSANVRFPSLLCLDEWMDDSNSQKETQTKKMYRLKSVVSHYGSHDYGHYIAYRLSRDKWWRISDETVYQTELSYVLSDGSIFMLFYELAAPEEADELYTQMIEEQKEQQSHGSGAVESSEEEEESEEEDDSEVEEEESEDEDME